MKLQDQTRFYFLKREKFGNPGNHPYGCVALVVDGGKIYRGVSICSERDQFNKKTGKRIAERNARFMLRIRQFANEGYKEFRTHGGEPVGRVSCVVGSGNLWVSIVAAKIDYGLSLLNGDSGTYSKASEETWDTLTDYERRIFISNDKSAAEQAGSGNP